MTPLLTHFHLPRALLAASLLAAAGGCAAPQPAPAPFTGPAIRPSLRYFAGTPLSGPRDGKPEGNDIAPFTVEVVAHERWEPLASQGEPIGARARFLSVVQGERPIRTIPRLAAATRVVTDGVAAPVSGRSASLASVGGELAAGVTAAVRADVVGARRAYELQVHRVAGNELQVALVVFGAGPPAAHAVDDPGQPAPEPGRELVLLDPISAPAELTLAVLVPAAVPGQQGEALELRLAVGARQAPAGPPPELAAADASAFGPSAGVAAREAALSPALEALRHGPSQRHGLLYLASDAGAEIAADLALVADPAALHECGALVTQRLQSLAAAPERGDMAILLEACAVEYIASKLSRDTLAPELQAVILRHAGQAGRQPASLEEAAKEKSVPALRARLIAENWVALEDSAPSVRVRAFDWLRALGDAPEGYDPLAPPRSRRQALEAALAAKAAEIAGS